MQALYDVLVKILYTYILQLCVIHSLMWFVKTAQFVMRYRTALNPCGRMREIRKEGAGSSPSTSNRGNSTWTVFGWKLWASLWSCCFYLDPMYNYLQCGSCPDVLSVLLQMLCLIGEAFDDYSDDVCGAVVNIRTKGDKIAVWTTDYENKDAVTHIGLDVCTHIRNTKEM